jgi:RNA polymerase sigma factor (sigma-70 family)
VHVLVSEEELKRLMVSGLCGDATAHAALLSALVPLLRAYFRRRTRDTADEIEDLVQETLIAVHKRRATYDRDRAFTPWLFAIARYKMIDHFRRRQRECLTEALDEMLVEEGFEDTNVAMIDVQRLLEGLPTKQANAIRDTHLEGLSIAEAATHIGIGESDVKVSVHRGLKALAARIRGSVK